MALLYFILGILFVEIMIPLLDALLNVFLAWIETKKAKYSEIITESNVKMKKALASSEEQEVSPKRPIGFTVPTLNEQEEEDDEDDI